jgi:hypothetical protein
LLELRKDVEMGRGWFTVYSSKQIGEITSIVYFKTASREDIECS